MQNSQADQDHHVVRVNPVGLAVPRMEKEEDRNRRYSTMANFSLSYRARSLQTYDKLPCTVPPVSVYICRKGLATHLQACQAGHRFLEVPCLLPFPREEKTVILAAQTLYIKLLLRLGYSLTNFEKCSLQQLCKRSVVFLCK